MTNSLIRRVMLVMILFLLAACGGAPPMPGTGAVATSQPAGEATASEAETVTREAATTNAETPAATAGTGSTGNGELTVYSGRNEQLIGELIEQFERESGIKVNVRYGDTAELAATILEEGANAQADVFFAQDAGALGALAAQDRLQKLPESLLQRVDPRFRSPEGEWIGTSGRARVVVYNTATLTETDLPESIHGFTDPKWKGRLGWAPTNGSFQAFVTAMRLLEGEERARAWLEGVKANEPKVYDNNTAIVQAAAAGEIDAGFVNHYYLVRQLQEHGETFTARNYYLKNNDPGALINVAGAAILNTADEPAAAEQFLTFLVGDVAQQYFADKTFEYPMVTSVAPNPVLPPLNTIETPQIDLSKLEDLQGTLELLQELGIL